MFSRFGRLPPMEELKLPDLAMRKQEEDEHRCVAFCDYGHNHADHHEGVGSPVGMAGRDPVDEEPEEGSIGSLTFEPVDEVEEPTPDLF